MRGFPFLCCAADTVKTLALFETMLAGLPVDFGAAESRTGTSFIIRYLSWQSTTGFGGVGPIGRF
jgi:hypothetical protein